VCARCPSNNTQEKEKAGYVYVCDRETRVRSLYTSFSVCRPRFVYTHTLISRQHAAIEGKHYRGRREGMEAWVGEIRNEAHAFESRLV